MTRPASRPRRLWLGILSGVVLLSVPQHSASRAEERPPDALEADGIVKVDTERLVELRLPGTSIAVYGKDGPEARFSSRASNTSGSERPLAVWFEDDRIVLAPPPGQRSIGGIVYVEVPTRFTVKAEVGGGTATFDSLSGSVEVKGKDTKVIASTLNGSLDVDVEGGTIDVQNSQEVKLHARGTRVTVGTARGPILARLSAGSVTLDQAWSGLDLETEDTQVKLTGAGSAVTMKIRGGSASVSGLKDGGRLTLAGSELKIESSQGDIEISSDSNVQFKELSASLHLDMYGGVVRGVGNQGIVEVRTRNTEVNVESIDGAVRIQGEGLNAKLADLAGDLYVETSASEVSIDKVAGTVELLLDHGSVFLKSPTGPVTATIRGGDAKLVETTGPIQLEVDGGNTDVSIASLTGTKDSVIKSASGDVTLRFAQTASCRVEAKTRFGRIESSLPTVEVLDEGGSAQGPVGRGSRPVIHVEANGNVSLLDATSSGEN